MISASLFTKYTSIIKHLPHCEDNTAPRPELCQWEESEKKLKCYYAPFEYINTNARLILVGITPGKTQMNRALNAACRAIAQREDIQETIREVKRIGSFSGEPMRGNIVAILNRLGYQKRLGISSAAQLWETHDHLVHFCSLLKFPVFKNRTDYRGTPKPLGVKQLRSLIMKEFVADLGSINPDADLIPLGDRVAEVISVLREQGLIPQRVRESEGRIVALPHPSGENGESIALLLRPDYPEKEVYEETTYRDYLRRKPWKKKKNGIPQSEVGYKAARASRWESMLFVRHAHGIPDTAR